MRRRVGLGLLGVASLLAAVALLLPTAFWLTLPARLRRLLKPPHPFINVEWQADSDDTDKSHGLPNVILIVADDLGINDLNGGAGIRTPNIDSIAMAGARFTTAYSGHATCAPSRAAIFTGRVPTKMGFEFTPSPKSILRVFSWMDSGGLHPSIYNHELAQKTPHMRDMFLPRNFSTIAEELRSLRYRNYLVGKWHLGGLAPHTALDRGFHETLTFPAGFSSYAADGDRSVVRASLQGSGTLFDEVLSSLLPFYISHNNGPSFQPDKYMTDFLTHQAVKLIDSKASSTTPFFLALTYSAPHSPLQATMEDFEDPEVSQIANHTARVYAAMIKALDRGVGEVLKALRRTGKHNDTLVIFTSDNGAAHYLGLPRVNHPFRGWKCTFFEGGIRVPLMLQWPRRVRAGQRIERPVSHVDLFTTILEAAGKTAGVSTDGVSLLSDMQRAEPDNWEERPLFWRAGHYRAMRRGNWKIQRALRPNKTWLFDLHNDPTERIDLAPSAPSNETLQRALKQMGRDLDEENARQAFPLWPSVLEAAMMVDRNGDEQATAEDEYVYWTN